MPELKMTTLTDCMNHFQDLVHCYAGDEHLDEFVAVMEAIVLQTRKECAQEESRVVALEEALGDVLNSTNFKEAKGIARAVLGSCPCCRGRAGFHKMSCYPRNREDARKYLQEDKHG